VLMSYRTKKIVIRFVTGYARSAIVRISIINSPKFFSRVFKKFQRKGRNMRMLIMSIVRTRGAGTRVLDICCGVGLSRI